ncbi:hypothetical protein DTL42_17985 [Bremerella cremea]|uniref:Uncharacterized protein n=1 Tax=Bremerella cremea TaxID=1031537 RepID=A0A368KMW6_9BACT|nr:hypothetical protein [Bremerella cremea]RCS44022.1 hypothetical protein DTL42_17985 [Bremerella cremea]
MIGQQSLTSYQTTVVPAKCLEIDLKQIQGVSVCSYPDTVPAYLIFDIEQMPPAKRDSAVWGKVKEKRYYYECSNLTVAPSAIAAAIKERLAQTSPAT